MLNNDLSQQIKRNFPYKPTEEQENAVKSFAEFLFSPSADSVFLMKGYAGTGKTTLTSALVCTLDSLQRKVILLAPTGRAAKVFSGYAEHPSHSKRLSGDISSYESYKPDVPHIRKRLWLPFL